jgi:ubiquinone biosynthesis protein UbiJ
MQVSFTNGKRLGELTQGQLNTSLIDDAEGAIAHRLNADSYAASVHPDSLLNKVKFGETKAGLLAQLIEKSDNTLQQSIEEQTKLVADFFTKQKALEVNGKAVKQKMMDDVLSSVEQANAKVKQQLDHPIKNPCDL